MTEFEFLAFLVVAFTAVGLMILVILVVATAIREVDEWWKRRHRLPDVGRTP